MSGSMQRSFLAVAGLVLSAAAVWIVLQAVDIGEAASILGRAAPLPVVAIVGVVALQLALRATRWSYLLPAIPRIRPVRLLPPLLIGYLGNTALPARLGEPMRAVVVARREPVGTTEALGSVLLERVIDVATLAMVAFAAAVLVGSPAWTAQALGFAAVAGLVGIVLLGTIGIDPVIRLADRLGLRGKPGVRALVVRFASTVGGRSRRRAILLAAAISIGAWLLDAASFWLAGQAVGADVSYAAAALIAGVTVLGTAIPSAPGYVGTFELAAISVAGMLGVPSTEALALAVVAHVVTLVPMALGGAVSLAVLGLGMADVARSAEAGRRA